MATAAVAGGLMPHQKDEHDVWICKECGWKYPNAKPSPKIRKHHKKNCPGKAGEGARAHGSSDEASDGDHHPAAKENVEATTPVDSTPREFDFAALKAEREAEVPVEESKPEPVAEPVPEPVVESKEPPPPSPGKLMAHQKDEHDIWICKECGWKYPNAKPSPKIRKHHKKNCPGKGGSAPKAPAGSSDDASDEEHHHGHSHAVSGSATQASPPSVSKEIDFAALKEAEPEPEPEPAVETPSVLPQLQEESIPEIPAAGEAPAPEAPTEGLEVSSREIDFPALKAESEESTPVEAASSVPGSYVAALKAEREESTPVEAASSIPENVEASTPVDSTPREFDFAALKAEREAEVPVEESKPEPVAEPVPEPVVESKEPPPPSHGNLMAHQKDEHDIWICKECGWKYPNAKPSPKIRKHHKKNCPGKGGSAPKAPAGSSDDASDEEHHHGHSHAVSGSATQAPPPGVSKEIDFAALKEAEPEPEPAVETPSVLPQLQEESIPEIPAAGEAPAPEAPTEGLEVSSREIDFPALKAESEESTPVEAASSVPGSYVAALKVEKEEAPKEVPEVSSREIDFAALKAEKEESTPVEAASSVPAAEAGSLKTAMDEQPPKPVSLQEAIQKDREQEKQAAAASGHLMPHQKDEHDVWQCKECGWKYPNAKPSPKIKRNHKKKCPGSAGGVAPAAGGSSDEATDDEHHTETAKGAEPVNVGATEVTSREFSFAPPAETPTPAAESKVADPVTEKEIPTSDTGVLMPNQKDEHDVWQCKECGWKYPNAKPSAKIRKNHKKKCTGAKGGAPRNKEGESSDTSTDDEKNKDGSAPKF